MLNVFAESNCTHPLEDFIIRLEHYHKDPCTYQEQASSEKKEHACEEKLQTTMR